MKDTDRKLFRAAITDVKGGRSCADTVIEYLSGIGNSKQLADDEWWDARVFDLASGADVTGWRMCDLTDHEMWRMLGAALKWLGYECELFFTVGPHSVIGHWLFHIYETYHD